MCDHLLPLLSNVESSSNAYVLSDSEPLLSRKLVLIFQDQSMFYSNDDQGWMWGEKNETIIKSKDGVMAKRQLIHTMDGWYLLKLT